MVHPDKSQVLPLFPERSHAKMGRARMIVKAMPVNGCYRRYAKRFRSYP